MANKISKTGKELFDTERNIVQTKKESKGSARSNKKMTDQIRKDDRPIHPVTKQVDQETEQTVETEIEWEVSPDVNDTRRRLVSL